MNVLHLAKIIAARMPHVATQMVRMTVRVTEASLGMVSIVQVLAAVTGFMKKISAPCYAIFSLSFLVSNKNSSRLGELWRSSFELCRPASVFKSFVFSVFFSLSLFNDNTGPKELPLKKTPTVNNDLAIKFWSVRFYFFFFRFFFFLVSQGN